jgi:hypothetical protein
MSPHVVGVEWHKFLANTASIAVKNAKSHEISFHAMLHTCTWIAKPLFIGVVSENAQTVLDAETFFENNSTQQTIK